MRVFIVDFFIGLVWGLLFFFFPILFSNLYGFWGYDIAVKIVPSTVGALVLLLLFYLILSIIIFFIYGNLVDTLKKQKNNFKPILLRFLVFIFGFIIILISYLVIGFFAFSSGNFSL